MVALQSSGRVVDAVPFVGKPRPCFFVAHIAEIAQRVALGADVENEESIRADDAGDAGASEDGEMMDSEGTDDGSSDGESPNSDMNGDNSKNGVSTEGYRIFDTKFDEVIAAADEKGLAMVMTGMRHFRH